MLPLQISDWLDERGRVVRISSTAVWSVLAQAHGASIFSSNVLEAVRRALSQDSRDGAADASDCIYHCRDVDVKVDSARSTGDATSCRREMFSSVLP